MSDTRDDAAVWHDPIVAEVRAIREVLFAAAGYDIREFCRHLRAEQAASGHELVPIALQPSRAKAEGQSEQL
jgi:hypothetical protein